MDPTYEEMMENTLLVTCTVSFMLNLVKILFTANIINQEAGLPQNFLTED